MLYAEFCWRGATFFRFFSFSPLFDGNMAHIHYKFASKRSPDTVIFDGPHVTLQELKRLIMEREKLRSGDCDLQITNSQTKEGKRTRAVRVRSSRGGNKHVGSGFDGGPRVSSPLRARPGSGKSPAADKRVVDRPQFPLPHP